jgi:hypothetical protein
MVALNKCVTELRQDPEWTDEEIAEVEATARKVIESAASGGANLSGRTMALMVGVPL